MEVADCCSTEEAIRTLLEHLVAPILPAKPSSTEPPLESQQQAVAKQVHAVLVLYNYYHKKQNSELEFLGFKAFCQLAVILSPALLPHLKFMNRSNEEMEDLESNLSIVDKTIMKACDLSRILDPSRETPNAEGWLISKVAIFLVDVKRENCLVLFSSMTQGIWSLIEKDVDIVTSSSESASGSKLVGDRKRRSIRKLSNVVSKIDLSNMCQLAFSAVKEATGIVQTDLKVLEEHVVYSVSREKEASRLYIMEITKSVNASSISVPVADVLRSLKGPLFEKRSERWEVTPVVEYFHVLPYASVLSEWSHRLKSPSPSVMHKFRESSSLNNIENKTTHIDLESSREVDRTSGFNSQLALLANDNCIDMPHRSPVGKANNVVVTFASSNDLDKRGGDENAKFDLMDLTASSYSPYLRADKFAQGNEGNGISNLQLLTHQSISEDYDKVQITMDASRKNILSQTALKVLMRKRDKLAMQLRDIQDDIAECDGKIQKIRNDDDDGFTLAIESVIEGCNDVLIVSCGMQERSNNLDEQISGQYNKRKRLSDSVIPTQSKCEELDGLCKANSWSLPTYCIRQAEGGFRGNVRVKGGDLDISSSGDVCGNGREARESAAAHVLAELNLRRSFNIPT